MNNLVKDHALFLTKSAEIETKISKLLNNTSVLPTNQKQLLELLDLADDVNTLNSQLIQSLKSLENFSKRLVHRTKIRAKLQDLKPVTDADLQRLVQVLGYSIIRDEAEASILLDYLHLAKKVKNRHQRTLLKNAVWNAKIARGLAEMMQVSNSREAFFAGLNFHVGKLLLALNDERSHEEIEKMKLMGMDSASAESAILGFNVSELAKRFLLNQKLPDAVIDVVVNGHERKNKTENDALLNIVKFADVIVRAINEERRSLVEVWHESKNFLQELKLDVSFDEWNRQIKLIFFRLVKFENEI
ncbi:MAG: HDOD domain-containing protein [Candidatus Melainabacteria bacterium]|nr:HDOD domain-containing protein [Candidatus Melainabacteria bacterium]